MVEGQRKPVHEERFRQRAGYGSVCQVPRADVVDGIAQNTVIREVSRHKIGPALISEEPMRDVIETERLETLRPPVRKAMTFRTILHADEPQVVDTVL